MFWVDVGAALSFFLFSSFHRFTLFSLFKIQLKFKCTTTWKWDPLKSVKRKRARRRCKEGIDKLRVLEVSPMSFAWKTSEPTLSRQNCMLEWKGPSMAVPFLVFTHNNTYVHKHTQLNTEIHIYAVSARAFNTQASSALKPCFICHFQYLTSYKLPVPKNNNSDNARKYFVYRIMCDVCTYLFICSNLNTFFSQHYGKLHFSLSAIILLSFQML